MSLLIATASGLSSVDVATGNLVKSYKQSENGPAGLALLAPGPDRGPASVLALQRDRPLVHHYLLKKEAVAKRVVLPGKMASLAVSPNGQWLAMGSQTGALYVWNMRSGALKTLASDAHFQAISCLAWSRDSSVLVSGGGDARVLVWRTVDLVSGGATMGSSQPKHVFTQHTLPVVACVFGPGVFREARLYTASEDATVCVFDVFSGRLLYTLACDATKLHSLAVDPAERAVYLGGNDGVHCVPLYFEPANSAKLVSVGSVEGSVVSTNTVKERVLKPEASLVVTSLAVSTDAAHLFVGTEDGSVSSWETGSGQLVKKYRSTKGAAVQLVYSTADFNTADSQLDELPVLQRTIETESLDFVPKMAHEAPDSFDDADLDKEMDEIDGFDPANDAPSAAAGEAVPDKEAEKEDTSELEELRTRHEQLQKMYDALWARHTQK